MYEIFEWKMSKDVFIRPLAKGGKSQNAFKGFINNYTVFDHVNY